MDESLSIKLKTFSMRHRQYIISILNEIVDYYGDSLLGCAVFGSYARYENRKNSDLDLLIILKKAPGFSRRIKDFVENVEMKHEPLAQEIYEQDEILCDLSPYIVTREEALKLQPVYYDLVQDHLIIYDPDGLIMYIINSTQHILQQAEAGKARHANTWEWQTAKIGFPGGMNL